MDKKRILIAEDDDGIREGLRYALEQEGYAVTACSTVVQAKEEMEARGASLCLLDVTLPDGTGYELCTRAGLHKPRIPVIFLTACDAEVSVIMGLDMGADDYITKPFRVRELISRIRSVLRRSSPETDGAAGANGANGANGAGAEGTAPGMAAAGTSRIADEGNESMRKDDELRLGDIVIRLTEARVFRGEGEILLTSLEYRLLLVFARHPGQLLSRNQLLESIWDVAGDFVNDNTVSVYIKRLREKLGDDPREPRIIQTVRGFGYRAGV